MCSSLFIQELLSFHFRISQASQRSLTVFSEVSQILSQVSHRLLRGFSKVFHRFLTDFPQTSQRFLKGLSQVSHRLLTDFSQTFIVISSIIIIMSVIIIFIMFNIISITMSVNIIQTDLRKKLPGTQSS